MMTEEDRTVPTAVILATRKRTSGDGVRKSATESATAIATGTGTETVPDDTDTKTTTSPASVMLMSHIVLNTARTSAIVRRFGRRTATGRGRERGSPFP